MSPKPQQFILWTCVGGTTALVFTIWLVNARTTLYDVSRSRSAEGKILEEAKTDIGGILDDFSAASQKAAAERALEAAVAEEKEKRENEQNVKTALKQILGEKIIVSSTTHEK